MTEVELELYLSKIVEYFDKANDCYFSLMTNNQCDFLSELETIIEKYNVR